MKDGPLLLTDHSPNSVEWVVVDFFSPDTGKTANIIHRIINSNKTANIKGNN